MVFTDNPNHTKRRATTVEIKNCGCLLRNIYMEGNDVVGEVETLSNRPGQDIANLIGRDKVNIGFSLRALGSTNTLPDGTIEVQEPIKPITYDLVSNPSHASAHILEFLPEDVSDSSPDNASVVYEGEDIDFLVKTDRLNINATNQFEKNYISDVISNNFNSGLKRLKFKF